MPTTKKELLTINFSKPFEFEEKTFDSIDLSGLENVTASQLASVEEHVTAIVPELSMDYALLLASTVSDQPVEFFQSLPGKEGLKVKRLVQGFLNS